jgi:hypothetical protein
MKIIKTILLLISVFTLSGYSPNQIESEYPVKAASLYKFLDYIEWPENSNETFFNITVLGNSPITSSLTEIAGSKLAKNKRISIKQNGNINNIGSPQVLFISRNSGYSIEEVISKMAGRPVLIVSEQPGSAEKGAHVNFFAAENKLRFEVNVKTANRSGLRISSLLLQHALVVN